MLNILFGISLTINIVVLLVILLFFINKKKLDKEKEKISKELEKFFGSENIEDEKEFKSFFSN